MIGKKKASYIINLAIAVTCVVSENCYVLPCSCLCWALLYKFNVRWPNSNTKHIASDMVVVHL